MTSLEQAKLIAKTVSDKKGEDVKIIKIREISVIADYFVIATGSNSTHVKALSDEIETKLEEQGIGVSHIEGYRSNSWILLDYIDVVVHVFDNTAREFYDLERLWQDGEVIDFEG